MPMSTSHTRSQAEPPALGHGATAGATAGATGRVTAGAVPRVTAGAGAKATATRRGAAMLATLASVAAMNLLAPPSVQAQPIAVTNAGFESNPAVDGAFAVVVPTGWQLYDPLALINQNSNAVGVIRPNVPQAFFPTGAPEGAQAALVFLAGASSGPAGLQQTLAATLQADTVYTLSVAVGNIASGTSLPGSSDGGGVFYNLEGFPGYRLELLAGGTLLGFDDSSAGVIPEGEWRTATLVVDSSSFVAQLGQPLTIRLINLDLAGTVAEPRIEVDFDAVQLVASAVPEPGAAALWTAGLGVVVALATRRQRRR